MKRTGTLLLALFLGVCFASHCEATVYNSDGSAANVQALHNAALDGDTITLPIGTFTWFTGVTITKAIKIQGTGSGRIIGRTLTPNSVGTGSKTFATQSGLSITTGQTLRVVRRVIQTDGNTDVSGTFMLGTVTSYSGTTLVMNITSTGGTGTYAAWYIATEPLTTINYTTTSGAAFSITPTTGNIEVSGIKFICPGPGGYGMLLYDAYPLEILIHDCWFKVQPNEPAIRAESNSVLIYQCSFDSPFSVVEAIMMKWENWHITTGNLSWTTVDTLGNRDSNGNKNFYIED